MSAFDIFGPLEKMTPLEAELLFIIILLVFSHVRQGHILGVLDSILFEIKRWNAAKLVDEFSDLD